MLRVLGVLLVLGLGGYGLHHWWVNRPHPLEPPKVELTLQAPAVTDYSKTPIVVHPLLLRFSALVAPIALVGKSPAAGIALSPRLPGTWLWRDDHTLSFMPQSDWPVGQHYRIELDRDKLLTAGVRLTEPRLGFDSAPFTAGVTSNEFYQDPQDPLQKSAIIGVSFNYPVDPSSFERSVALAMLDARGKPSQKYGFSVTYDARHLNAFVHSAPLGVPEDTRSGKAACPPYDPRYDKQQVFEFWPTDLQQVFRAAGIPRRAPPQNPACPYAEAVGAGAAHHLAAAWRGVFAARRPADAGRDRAQRHRRCRRTRAVLVCRSQLHRPQPARPHLVLTSARGR